MTSLYNSYDPYHYWVNIPRNNWDYGFTPYPYRSEFMINNTLTDHGPTPYVINLDEATKQNNNFRTALWTGNNLQVTLMSLSVGEDIGLEIHSDVDQFLRIEEGEGIVRMGTDRDNLDFERRVTDDFAIMIPAGTWHNVINTGNEPLKLYSIYAPPQHPHGTIHQTKADEPASNGDLRKY